MAAKQWRIESKPRVELDRLQGQVGIVASPGFRYSHMPAALGAVNMSHEDQGKILFMPDIGIVRPGLVPVAWNQDGTAADGRPGLATTTAAGSGVNTTQEHYEGGAPHRDRYKTNYARVDDIDDWEGATATWSWAMPAATRALSFYLNVGGGPDAENLSAQPQDECRFKIGDYWYRICLRVVDDASLDVSEDDRATWKRMQTIPTLPEWRSGHDVQVLVCFEAQRIQAQIGGMWVLCSPPLDGTTATAPTAITNAEVYSQALTTAQVSAHPRPWRGAATLHSCDINTGIGDLAQRASAVRWRIVLANRQTVGPFDAAGTYLGGARPSGSESLTVKTSSGYPTSGGLIAYDLIWDAGEEVDGTWHGESWAHQMPGVRYIDVEIPPVKLQLKTPRLIEVPGLLSVSTQKRFAQETLNIYTHSQVTVANYRGNWTLDGNPTTEPGLTPADPPVATSGNPWRVGETASMGLRAGAVQFFVNMYDEDGNMPPGYDTPQWGNTCYGVAGMQSGDIVTPQGGTFWFSVDDLSAVMRDQTLYFKPYLDGWCHYYAVAWCLEQAGLDPDRHLAAGVPRCRNPFCSNGTHYHLPMGDGGHPLCDPGTATSPWEVLQMVQKHTGHMAFFDRVGRLIYFPWNGSYPSAWDPLGYDRHFSVGVGDGLSTWDLPSMPSSVQTSWDMAAVRNKLLVVGLDAYGPRWLPIVAKRENAAGVNDDTSPVYKGYDSVAAWLDTKFVTQEYASIAADRVAGFLGKPDGTVSVTTCGDPLLMPLTRFYVDGPGAYRTRGRWRGNGTGYFRWMATAVDDKWDWESRAYSMTVHGVNIRDVG